MLLRRRRCCRELSFKGNFNFQTVRVESEEDILGCALEISRIEVNAAYRETEMDSSDCEDFNQLQGPFNPSTNCHSTSKLTPQASSGISKELRALTALLMSLFDD